MSEVFVIANQSGHFWGKPKAWVDGTQPRQVYRTPHHDEAVNTLVELSSRDPELRGVLQEVETSDKGEPRLTVSDIPLPGSAGENEGGEELESEQTAEQAAADSMPADP